MSNKVIIEKLKKQNQFLQKFKDGDDEQLRNWVDRTKIYILGLWLDKQDENLKKGTISMFEKYKEIIPTYSAFLDSDETYERIMEIKNRLQNLLEPFIEVVEIREKDLVDKGNNSLEKGKKSKNRKSD